MSRRGADFDLASAIEDTGFTPALRDVPALLDLLADGAPAVRDHAERALRRVGPGAVQPAMERASRAASGARGRFVALVGRIAGADAPADVKGFLLGALADEDAGVRRRAAVGLGRATAPDEAVEAALGEAAVREADAAARAAMVEALGKHGGAAAREALTALERGGAEDEKTAAALRKARVRAARPAAREEGSRVDTARALRPRVRVWLDCRRGMLPVLLEEAAALRPRAAHRLDGSLVAEVDLADPLASLFASRTWISAALPGASERIVAGDLVTAAARAITKGPAREAVSALTEGAVRYRIAWAAGGKRRASIYAIAEAVAAIERAGTASRGPRAKSDVAAIERAGTASRGPRAKSDAGAPGPRNDDADSRSKETAATRRALVNDPAAAPWEIVVRETAERVAVEWAPSLDDPRFAYRRGDVPAASHPTIAAALAFLAGARDDDVVWDPFVGSGLELCERALRGPYARLVGTDLDAAALDVARANLTACGAERFDLRAHDAALGAPPGVRPTLVITNPPMGRRVHRSADLRGLLTRFVAGAARALAPGGRLVWVSPFAADTRAAAQASGLTIRRGHVVDLGGFDAEIQVWSKKA